MALGILNPIKTEEGGGGAIVPSLTLDLCNFFHKQANLGDFS